MFKADMARAYLLRSKGKNHSHARHFPCLYLSKLSSIWTATPTPPFLLFTRRTSNSDTTTRSFKHGSTCRTMMILCRILGKRSKLYNSAVDNHANQSGTTSSTRAQMRTTLATSVSRTSTTTQSRSRQTIQKKLLMSF